MSKPMHTFSCAVVTMSDKGAAGQRHDGSGQSLLQILKHEGYTVKAYTIVPDKEEKIIETLRDLAVNQKIDLVITTGGTGVSPTDVTPEAMRKIIDKEIPGITEAMRAESLKKTPHAMLSRGIAGILNECLIINLPGSEKAARENLEVVLTALPHAIEKIKGSTSDCGN